jgi:BRCT domain type II-containing protein
MLITNKKAVLGSKVKPVMKLIENLDEEEFKQLIDGMVLLFQGIQQFKKSRVKKVSVSPKDAIDRAERILEEESKKKNGKVAK